MNVARIALAQAVRIIRLTQPVYMPDVAEALRDRYNFLRVPQNANEMLPPNDTTPVVFEHGKLVADGVTLLIQSLNLYNGMIVVNSPISTEQADRVVDDLLAWRDDFAEAGVGRLYVSHLEVRLDVSLDAFSPLVQRISDIVVKMVSGYESRPAPPFALFSFGLLPDPGLQYPLACDFRVERRVNIPHAQNIYYSQAPLGTNDHVAVLVEIEKAVASLAG